MYPAQADMLFAHRGMLFAQPDMLFAHSGMVSAHPDMLCAHSGMVSAHPDLLFSQPAGLFVFPRKALRKHGLCRGYHLTADISAGGGGPDPHWQPRVT